MSGAGSVSSYKDLLAWQKALQLCLEVYRTSRSFPLHERFGLTVEIRKTARSVVCNIAEGQRRDSTPDYLRFLSFSRGSQAELETQLLVANSLGYIEEDQAPRILELCDEVGRLIFGLARALKRGSV